MHSCVQQKLLCFALDDQRQRERERVMLRNRLGDAVKFGSGRDQEGLHCRKKPPAHDLVVGVHYGSGGSCYFGSGQCCKGFDAQSIILVPFAKNLIRNQTCNLVWFCCEKLCIIGRARCETGNNIGIHQCKHIYICFYSLNNHATFIKLSLGSTFRVHVVQPIWPHDSLEAYIRVI